MKHISLSSFPFFSFGSHTDVHTQHTCSCLHCTQFHMCLISVTATSHLTYYGYILNYLNICLYTRAYTHIHRHIDFVISSIFLIISFIYANINKGMEKKTSEIPIICLSSWWNTGCNVMLLICVLVSAHSKHRSGCEQRSVLILQLPLVFQDASPLWSSSNLRSVQGCLRIDSNL